MKSLLFWLGVLFFTSCTMQYVNKVPKPDREICITLNDETQICGRFVSIENDCLWYINEYDQIHFKPLSEIKSIQDNRFFQYELIMLGIILFIILTVIYDQKQQE